MKTWKDITAEDMGRILLARIPGGTDLHTMWEKFRDFIENYQKRDKDYVYPYQWRVWLITVCAAIYESGETEFQKIDWKDLKEKYKLERATCDDKHLKEFDNNLKKFDPQGCSEEDGFEEMKRFIQSLSGMELNLGNILDRLIPYKEANSSEVPKVKEQMASYFDKGDLLNIWKKLKKEELEKAGAGEVLKHLENGGAKQIILNGAPGTGKTYTAKLLAEYLGSQLPGEKNFYTLVQFHPSYDYTDFVEGLRPVAGENDRMIYKKLDGHFKSFCRRVVKENKKNCPNKDGVDDPDRKYFFLIDEINRADLSKVFGELMFCLESDKRGEKVRTQYQNLPTYDPEAKKDLPKDKDVFAGGFFIPKNVYIIGTMNDIDRSVESMDFALRRRFIFKEIVVDELLLKNAFQRIFKNLDDVQRDKLVKSVDVLNKKIEAKGRDYNLNRQYFISQGQFANLPEGHTGDLDQIKRIAWEYRIEPLLREYLRGESEDDIEKFVNDCKDAYESGKVSAS